MRANYSVRLFDSYSQRWSNRSTDLDPILYAYFCVHKSAMLLMVTQKSVVGRSVNVHFQWRSETEQTNGQRIFRSNKRLGLLDALVSPVHSAIVDLLSLQIFKTKKQRRRRSSSSNQFHTLYSSITRFDTFSSISFFRRRRRRVISFFLLFLFYIYIWKTKHVLNSFNIFD